MNINVTDAASAMSIGDNLDVVHSAEDRQQRVGGVAALLEAVEIDVGEAGDDAGSAVQEDGLDAGGELDASGGEVGVGFGLSENGGALVGMREAAVLVDVLELAIHIGDESVVRRGAGLGKRTGEEKKNGCEAHVCIVYEPGRVWRVAGFSN